MLIIIAKSGVINQKKIGNSSEEIKTVINRLSSIFFLARPIINPAITTIRPEYKKIKAFIRGKSRKRKKLFPSEVNK